MREIRAGETREWAPIWVTGSAGRWYWYCTRPSTLHCLPVGGLSFTSPGDAAEAGRAHLRGHNIIRRLDDTYRALGIPVVDADVAAWLKARNIEPFIGVRVIFSEIRAWITALVADTAKKEHGAYCAYLRARHDGMRELADMMSTDPQVRSKVLDTLNAGQPINIYALGGAR